MNRKGNFLWVFMMAVAFCFVMIGGTKTTMAGDYPGKWYGWYCPFVKLDSPQRQTPAGWKYTSSRKILKSWGYKANDVAEIKDLLPQMFYDVVKNPETWGNIRINETEYIHRSGEHWKRFKEATDKYKGQSSLDEKGHLRNYHAGTPFPGTEDPMELYMRFRGSEPKIDALLERRGLN